ncbi:MAG TPA: DeoR/GlpR family DNA-binding transcription regulator [Mobilitalea sp.]|nr:DeoR/GlpR family DNA-binding transcription regulator [Mobilitalea sp.]
MLIEKRLGDIINIVEQKKSVSVQELMQLLNASESTIRRDLNTLDANGQIIKVHGGAIAVGGGIYYTKDDDVINRKDMNKEAKVQIAKYAASLIKPNDFIYIDAGTTTELMIDYIVEKNAVFVTNAAIHAKKLSQIGCTTYILGGEFKATTEAIVGDEAVISLSKYNFTKGFWGTNGVSLTTGFSTPDVKEAMIKQRSMERCKERYVLCDDSKFSQISSVTFAEFSSAKIITNLVKEEAYSKCTNIVEVSK